jgi:NADH-quinone oxidoreductase subunit F
VETLANVPYILFHGGSEYAKLGTEGSKGTKVFSLVGKVRRTGLVEVPMGVTLRKLVFHIGGGISHGRKFKAVQTGGPSGGCIPEKLMDLQIDFDSLKANGSMMGSGGLIVMDDTTCMVELARYYVKFLSEESCGKCTPCREGLRCMLEILTRICEGNGDLRDLELLEELCETASLASLCELGKTAANPVMSTLSYFREEYIEHIVNKRCPAGVCTRLITFRILPEKCKGCGLCAKSCPAGAIAGELKKPYLIDQEACIKCGSCKAKCNV